MMLDSGVCSAVGLLITILLTVQGLLAQKVKVEPEVVSYPGETVVLRCQFPDPGKTQLTQVSWILEKSDGTRTNIAVFHPTYGVNYPVSPVEGRVSFITTPTTLDNPTIQIEDIALTDEGKYICEYAAYPTGNEKGITSLVILAKPVNLASIITVPVGDTPVSVARCESANGRPPATITWLTSVNGNSSAPVTADNSDNTVTVRSEYVLKPTPADDGKEISCKVTHRTLPNSETFPMKLVIQYPPQVTIAGYDDNWYIGRTNVVLTCQFRGNPVPTTVNWKMSSGFMPDTVEVSQNKLTVLKVDESINNTFICEVTNSLGTGKDQVAVFVRASRLVTGAATGSIIGAIIGLILFIALIATIGVVVYKQCMKRDRPPTHKPPPPQKHTTISYSAVQPPVSNTQNNIPLEYYETQRVEPVTDLDSYIGDDEDDDPPKMFDPNTVSGLEDSEMPPPYYEFRETEMRVDAIEQDQSLSSLSREDSFMSAPMIV
ncbi:nectin-2 isoform X2 [Tachysurus vachellii]|uniref:nectin-2 isoform X2 n=1 Tax=Tachysurus vachellii TaxID=175792 RepID=UPI00296B02F9|nr:nectin-2 isoform X2 [Tachysurus vachellii]